MYTIMKQENECHHVPERVSTNVEIKTVLKEEWDKITLEEINHAIEKLPIIMSHGFAVHLSNNFHT